MKNQIAILGILMIISCTNDQNKLDVQGHRGFRGMFPENSIEGFIAAADLGVTTLELDLVVSKDLELIVSHEPWFSEHFCRNLSDQRVSRQDSTNNLFRYSYAEIKEFDCGSWGNPRFPEQKSMRTYKPSLNDVVKALEASSSDDPNIRYNIELKRRPEWDGVYLPDVHTFVDLVLKEIFELGITDRTTLQCFDFETLQVIKRKAPTVEIAALIETTFSIDTVSKALQFKPDIISPLYSLLDKKSVAEMHRQDMRVIPWTVNEIADMQMLIEMGVDGIITDYPDRLLPIIQTDN